MNNDFDLNLKLVSETSNHPYSGVSIWKSSNLEIKETRGGGKRQGYEGIYSVFYEGTFVKDIKFDYATSLKKELENIKI